MPFSLHSHSGQFCKHGEKTLEECVLASIKAGFKVLGLSEHMPRFHESEMYPEEVELDMGPKDLCTQFEEYVAEGRRLQKKYKDSIHILVGFESERLCVDCNKNANGKQVDQDINKDDDPLETALNECGASFSAKIRQLKTVYDLDFVVGAIHHVDGVPIDFDEDTYLLALKKCERKRESDASSKRHHHICGGKETQNSEETLVLLQQNKDALEEATEELFVRYFQQLGDLVELCKPDVVGHFDLIRLFRPLQPLTPRIWESIRVCVGKCMAANCLFEINTSGLRKGLHDPYPQRDITKFILEQGGRFTLGDDAHKPVHVAICYEKLLDFFDVVGLKKLFVLMRNEQAGGVDVKEFKEWRQWLENL
eukprot:m.34913 g.34913  ORF g.34913 m.34913 type:complete len:366 (+) comp6566_c1_seq1:141-1238(+)